MADEVKNLLAIDDIADDFRGILEWAIRYKQDPEPDYDFKPLDEMSIGCIYEKPSTRTRVSFEVGIHKLGGQPLTLLKNDIQMGKSETISDTAAVLSRFLDGITYRCFGHEMVEELANNSTVPVINALSAKHHPCQAAADLMTILERNPSLEGEKMAWVGDGNNVLHDLMLACAILGVDCTWAVPAGYEPDADIVKRAEELAKKSGSKLTETNNPIEAVSGASAIYTDVFISMGEDHLKDKIKAFEGFQVNEDLVSFARDDYVFMHCLPAHRGDEVTDGVMDSENSVVFDQAENRMWAQIGLLVYLCNPAAFDAYLDLY
ncbi:MAG: ornithine carbamoyltransferase [Candidatus Thalassarchaeaceae archaeon]|jgi:ornithine carbamoyltransferase|nr:ornithine carbamoyltransferase [Candidatus Thalassarchaeaceae archaeon]